MFGLVAIQDGKKCFGPDARHGLANRALRSGTVPVMHGKTAYGFAHIIPADDGLKVFADCFLFGHHAKFSHLAPQIWFHATQYDGATIVAAEPVKIALISPDLVADPRVHAFSKQGYLRT